MIPSLDVRESMREFGTGLPQNQYRILQATLTCITGKSLIGQTPLLEFSPWTHLFLAIISLIGGAVVSVVVLQVGGLCLFAVPFSVALTLSASRTLWLTHLHAARTRIFLHQLGMNKFWGIRSRCFSWSYHIRATARALRRAPRT